jgi:peptidoglycan/LPS O-acetylase OafA/YrhL
VKAPAPAYLNALTGLRFLAAFHVVLFHFRELALADGPEALYWIADKGYVSVGLFFVLSGFILTYTYADSTHSAPLNRRAFWAARFARIYPVYLLSVVIAAPALISLITESGSSNVLSRTVGVVALVATLGQDWMLMR